MRLGQLLEQSLASANSRAERLALRLQHASPEKAIQNQQSKLQQLSRDLMSMQGHALKNKRQQLQRIADILNSVSPLSTLSRGYSISFKNEEVVRSVEDLQEDDIIETRLADGKVISKVALLEKR
jgi:exodeoxyribonuclease VII large subunit